MTVKKERAKYGAAAFASSQKAEFPAVFPRTMGPNCQKYLKEIVDSGLTVDMTGRFEKAFAQAMGRKHFVGTPGCSNALHMLAASWNYTPGDEIIVSPVTDYGSIMGMLVENYLPVFCDTTPGAPNITAETIAPRITDRTRAILVVHKLGLPCDMDPILYLAAQHKLDVYEDCCQAVFSEYKGRRAGSFGRAAAFSFDAEKSMGSDIGGGVLTNDTDLADRLAFMGLSRGGVQEPGYGRRHTERGLALRMPNCTAAICLGQLEIAEKQVRQRDRTVRLMTRLLADIPGIIPLSIPDYCTLFSCWMYGFSIDPAAFRCTADEFAAKLNERGMPNVGTGRYYLIPEAVTFLQQYTDQKRYPFSVPPASRCFRYDAASCPNGRDFLANFVRWFWTEKYNDTHIEQMAEIIRAEAKANRK